MDANEALETLKKFNKWRRGKGKKYSQPGFPADLTPEGIGLAIDKAISTLKHRIPHNDFVVLYQIVESCKSMGVRFNDEQKAAVAKMRKVVKYIKSLNGETSK